MKQGILVEPGALAMVVQIHMSKGLLDGGPQSVESQFEPSYSRLSEQI